LSTFDLQVAELWQCLPNEQTKFYVKLFTCARNISDNNHKVLLIFLRHPLCSYSTNRSTQYSID